MPVPFKVKAVFEYRSEEPDDLNFDNGQIIIVTEEEDADWYTGEYINTQGEKKEGLFPRNFVEKYEPAIPSRPARNVKRPPPQEAAEPTPAPPTLQQTEQLGEPPRPVQEAEIEPPKGFVKSTEGELSTNAPAPAPAQQPAPASVPTSPPVTTKPTMSKAPPPVADKPSTSSFRDRIAAFNKPAAPPVAPFKPNGQGSTGFIKKPFVAPPPSKNAYVPPPREPPPQKVYRREDDMSLTQEEPAEAARTAEPTADTSAEDQPKPTSLKDRIALLQKQQMEQAARQAEPAQKKDKPKRPPKQRTHSSEAPQEPATSMDAPLARADTNETIGKNSDDFAEEQVEHSREASSGYAAATAVPPSRELVSDTNDADDSGAADTEDAQETSTEEDRPKSKGSVAQAHFVETEPTKNEGVDEDEEEAEEEEDPDVRRKRELRERMAKMSGGMGMMGMFGPPGGGMSAARKPKTSAEAHSPEQYHEESAVRAPPVPIMALPGMTNNSQRRTQPVESDSEVDETAEPTPQQEISPHSNATEDDYVSEPPKRTSTDRTIPRVVQGTQIVHLRYSCGSLTSVDRAVPPPPERDTIGPRPPPPAERPVPPAPQSPRIPQCT